MNWHEYFTYDAATGNLIRKERSRESFATYKHWRMWNGREAGTVAGTPRYKKTGELMHIAQKFFGKLYMTHRIIWEMHNGPIPQAIQIDHRDGNPANNKLTNLRLATHTENMRNRKRGKTNTLGVKGVSRSWNRWRAMIRINGKSTHLGTFDTKGLAAVAYAKASMRHYGAFARIG